MSMPVHAESTGGAAPKAAGKFAIGPVEINNSFSGQNYLPCSIALLQTYVLYKRVRIADAAEALKGQTWSASRPTSGATGSRSACMTCWAFRGQIVS
jgi:hypothetical protein